MSLMAFHHSNEIMPQTSEQIAAFNQIYADYPERPYLSPHRDLQLWLDSITDQKQYIVARKMMKRLSNGLLPGDIILLWRVSFDTLSDQSILPQYFEYDYGIDGYTHLEHLLENQFIRQLSPYENLLWHSKTQLKQLAKQKVSKGLSQLNKDELIHTIKINFTEAELAPKLTITGYQLTIKGEQALADNQAIIDKHPKKNLKK